MHELSIATNIVEIALEYAKKNNAEEVREIEIEVGELSGVVIQALEFAMDSATKNTIIENAKIILNKVKGYAKCLNCQNEFSATSLYEECPKCNTFNPEIIRGKELQVKSLVVE